MAELIILESENGIFENFKFILKGLNLSVAVVVTKISQTIKLKVQVISEHQRKCDIFEGVDRGHEHHREAVSR